MTNLTLHLPSLSDLGRETGLDGLDRTTRAARVASNEAEIWSVICPGKSLGDKVLTKDGSLPWKDLCWEICRSCR